MKEVVLKNSEIKALVSDEDFGEVLKLTWNLNPEGYIWTWDNINRRYVMMHRHIMAIQKPLNGLLVHHKNAIKHDNQRHNLELVTGSQNQVARTNFRVSATGYRGVYPNQTAGRYKAMIRYNYKLVYIGTFGSPKEAALAYDNKAKELFGDLAVLNFY